MLTFLVMCHIFFGNGKTFVINSPQGIRHTKRIKIQTKQEPQKNNITTPIHSWPKKPETEQKNQ
jgi:hypothetical protein